MAAHYSEKISEYQLDELFNFLDEHKDLAHGRLKSLDGKVRSKRLWEEICNKLNAMGGCIKTVPQWQKVWADKKYTAKKASAESRRSASATGGGPSSAPTLSHRELRVLSIMGDGFGERQTGARVPAFTETNESTSSQEILSTTEPPPLSPHHLESEVEDSFTEPREVSTPPPSTRPIRSQPSSSRRRQPDVRTRLFQIEQSRADREVERNRQLARIREELAGIKDILCRWLTE